MNILALLLLIPATEPIAHPTDSSPGGPERLPAEICTIAFLGNHFTSAAELSDLIAPQDEFRFLRPVVSIGASFNLAAAHDAELKIERHYKWLGYFDAQVVHTQIVAGDPSRTRLIFHIKEGSRYCVEDIRMEGCKSIAVEALASQWKLRKGEPYNRQLAVADIATIKDALGNLGIDSMVCDEAWWLEGEPARVRVRYEVRESMPCRVREIIIKGNTRTPSEVILDQIPLRPGEWLRFPALREAKRHLERLGVFEVHPRLCGPWVDALESDDPSGDSPARDILVEVREKDCAPPDGSEPR